MKGLKGLLVMTGVSDSHKAELIEYVTYIDNDDYIVIPEDQYDNIPESIGDLYGIHHIHVEF